MSVLSVCLLDLVGYCDIVVGGLILVVDAFVWWFACVTVLMCLVDWFWVVCLVFDSVE